MESRILETLVGVVLLVIGSTLAYLCLSNISTATPLRMGLSLIMMPLGIVMLFRAGRKEFEVVFLGKSKKISKSLIERNSDMAHDYNKTATTREKLRALSRME